VWHPDTAQLVENSSSWMDEYSGSNVMSWSPPPELLELLLELLPEPPPDEPPSSEQPATLIHNARKNQCVARLICAS
jgi:hypothetical protein